VIDPACDKAAVGGIEAKEYQGYTPKFTDEFYDTMRV
jgi:hypothetical protein